MIWYKYFWAKEGERLKKRIKKENTNLRFNILIIIVYIIGIILISRLFDLQIVNGASYRETSNTRLSRESVLEAARGEILDRSGNILASTDSFFNLELYKTKSDDETLNNCILSLINLFEQYQISYPDNFPMNSEGTEFTIEGEELKKWLSKYKLAEDATPDEAMQSFIKKYSITANSIQEAREKIPHTSGDEFCIVTNIKSVNKEKNKEDQEEER